MERGKFIGLDFAEEYSANRLLKPRGSLDSIEKGERGTNPQDKHKEKEEKKRKDKKSGILTGLFKRKKSKDDADEPERHLVDSARVTSPQSKTSMESLPSKSMSPDQQRSSKEQQRSSKESQRQPKPQKHTVTKPHKQPMGIMKINTDLDNSGASQQNHGDQTIRQVPQQEQGESGYEDCGIVFQSPVSPIHGSHEPFTTPLESTDPVVASVERPSSDSQWRGPNDYSQTPVGSTSVISPPQRFTPQVGGAYPEPPVGAEVSRETQFSIGARDLPEVSHGTDSVSPPSPLSEPASPGNDNHQKRSTETPGSVDTLSVDTPTWSDSSLRTYMDEENDIRDLFIIVHDKSNVPPAGPDHPITGRLFKEESKRLKEMNNQLDDLLVNWMSQRSQNPSVRSIQSAV